MRKTIKNNNYTITAEGYVFLFEADLELNDRRGMEFNWDAFEAGDSYEADYTRFYIEAIDHQAKTIEIVVAHLDGLTDSENKITQIDNGFYELFVTGDVASFHKELGATYLEGAEYDWDEFEAGDLVESDYATFRIVEIDYELETAFIEVLNR